MFYVQLQAMAQYVDICRRVLISSSTAPAYNEIDYPWLFPAIIVVFACAWFSIALFHYRTAANPLMRIMSLFMTVVGGVFFTYVRSTGLPLLGLNLRTIEPDTLLGRYVSTSHPMRMLGAFYDTKQALDPQNLIQVELKNSFDSLIFVEDSHAAHSFVYTQARAVHEFKVPLGTAGVSWLTKWTVAGNDPASYEAGFDSATAQVPGGAIWLASSEATQNAWGSTVASIPVTFYLGKRLRLTGKLAVTNAAIGGRFWMRVDGPNGVESFDNMSNRQLSGSESWTPFAIVLNVPSDAKKIAFGLILRGQGRVSATGIAVDVVDPSVPTTGT